MSASAKNLILPLLRPSVAAFTPYSSARDEYDGGSAPHFMDANENPLGSPVEQQLNRYPDPYQRKLREKVAVLYGVESEQILLGNGSDEVIDLLVRALIQPTVDELWVTQPSYGMYEVSAALQEAIVKTIRLTDDYDLPESVDSETFSSKSKLCFLCSPNNPTGNLLSRDRVLKFVESFPGIVVIDEAYIEFASEESLASELTSYPNLVILRTFSKAWGIAAARIGVGVMNPVLRSALDSIKPPYNINALTAGCALEALENQSWKDESVAELTKEKTYLRESLVKLPMVKHIFPSEANFLLLRVESADDLYQYLLGKGIVVRNRNGLTGCENCLRITVGTREENEALLSALNTHSSSMVN